MPSSRENRLSRELNDINKDKKFSGVDAQMVDGRLDHLKGAFLGPPDTPYAGGTFCVDIRIPPTYPFKAPEMRFDTRVWHPNVSSQTGAICLDTLGKSWSPVNTIKTALMSLRAMFENPNPSDPQDAQVAKMLLEEPEFFKIVAHDWAVRYAGAKRFLPTPEEYQRPTATTRPIEDTTKYCGYNRNLIGRFTDMGFSIEQVVDAFSLCRISRNGGQDQHLEPEVIGDITARLCNEM